MTKATSKPYKSTKSTKSASAYAPAAVLVSFRLQFAVVAASLITWAFQVSYSVSSILSLSGGVQLDKFKFHMITSSLFPLVVFAIALLATRRLAQPVSILFIAVLKTLLAVFLVGVLVGLKNWIVSILYGPGTITGSELRWLTSPGMDFALMGITLFCMIWILRPSAAKRS